MKKFVLLMLLVSSPVFARSFSIQAQCNVVSRSAASCVAWNNYAYPIYCKVEGQGRTSYGYAAYGEIWGKVAPGENIYLYIQANNSFYDPLVVASARATCRWSN